MIAYVTKYALSEGIYAVEGKLCKTTNTMLDVGFGISKVYYHHGEWHENYIDAIKKAEVMRNKRITSLRKQLAKLEALTFPSEAPEVEGVGK